MLWSVVWNWTYFGKEGISQDYGFTLEIIPYMVVFTISIYCNGV